MNFLGFREECGQGEYLDCPFYTRSGWQKGLSDVLPADQKASGFLKWGRLDYTGRHYLKFADGPYWIKGGIDSPEDFLSYVDFDNTPNAGHQYEAHVVDWQEGDPVWDGNKGKGIIGLLNYFASQYVNFMRVMQNGESELKNGGG